MKVIESKSEELITRKNTIYLVVDGNPLQYPCLENLMDRGAWWAAAHGVAKSQAQLSN